MLVNRNEVIQTRVVCLIANYNEEITYNYQFLQLNNQSVCTIFQA